MKLNQLNIISTNLVSLPRLVILKLVNTRFWHCLEYMLIMLSFPLLSVYTFIWLMQKTKMWQL